MSVRLAWSICLIWFCLCSECLARCFFSSSNETENPAFGHFPLPTTFEFPMPRMGDTLSLEQLLILSLWISAFRPHSITGTATLSRGFRLKHGKLCYGYGIHMNHLTDKTSKRNTVIISALFDESHDKKYNCILISSTVIPWALQFVLIFVFISILYEYMSTWNTFWYHNGWIMRVVFLMVCCVHYQITP